MIFNNRITDLTYHNILPKVLDAAGDGNILACRMLGAYSHREWRGTTINQTIQYKYSTTGGSFDGLDEMSTAQSNLTTQLSWHPKGYYQSVVMSGMEQDINTGEAQALSYVGSTMDQARTSLLNGMGVIGYGMGTGKDIDGIGLFTDDGTFGSTSYGGLSRATYGANINGYVDTAAALSLEELATAITGCSATGASKERPTIGYMAASVWDIYESLLSAGVQANYGSIDMNGYFTISGNTPAGKVMSPAKGLNSTAGFDCLSFRTIPFVPDAMAPEENLFLVNEHYAEFNSLKSTSAHVKSSNEGVKTQEGASESLGSTSSIQFREMMDSLNQYGSVGFLMVMGNFIHRNPKRNARLTGIVG